MNHISTVTILIKQHYSLSTEGVASATSSPKNDKIVAKLIKTKNAQLFFTLTHNQFVNGKITKPTYIARLEKLSEHIDRRSVLYSVLLDTISIAMNLAIYPLAKYDNRTMMLDKGYNILMERVKESGQLMEFKQIGTMRIADTDDLPSIPHLHLHESNIKVDVYTGLCSNNKCLSDKEFVNLWNDEEFYDKLYRNRLQLMF